MVLYDIESNGLHPGHLQRAQAQLHSYWLFSQETYHDQAYQWGFYTILGRPRLVKTYLKELERVSMERVDEEGETLDVPPKMGGKISVKPFWPVTVSATLFALMHLGHGPDPVPLFFFALGVGLLYQRTHRIMPSLIVHLLLNLFTLIMLILMIFGQQAS